MQSMLCVSKVEMHISCKGLKNKDLTSKSDPMVAVFMLEGSRWTEVARTEVVMNCLDPSFSKAIILDYYFEVSQKLRFDVYDIDNASKRLDDDDFLGRMECSLGQIVSSATYCQYLKSKSSSRQAGTITITAQELTGSNDIVHLTFRGSKLDKKDFLSKSDPYLEILKMRDDGSFQTVHRTETIQNTLNPQWKPQEISVHSLCNNDYNRKIKIVCYDWDDDGSHDLIGEFTTTLKEMLESTQNKEKTWDCINLKKQKKKKNYVNSGTITLSYAKLFKNHSFLDFVLGGCEVNFTVGIDFTASNGEPTHPQSLHFINPYEPNEYMKALTSVGEIVQDYDTDKQFPAFGFGARIPPTMQVSHEFALNFNTANPYCQGITGVASAYQTCLRQVKLYGPTNVAPIVNHVARFASEVTQKPGPSAYFVLLLLTDGVLSDMSQTKDAIVRASHLPMSIIIVGVGNADFADMNELDADEGRLRANSGYAARDIVQFVPFREFRNQTPSALAKCVLAEVPKQVVEYFKMKGIPPNKPQAGKTTPPAPSQGGTIPPSQAPYPVAGGPGQAPHPAQGQAPYPVPGQAPYPVSGQAPYPVSGQTPYPTAGHVQPPYPGQAPYPNMGPGQAPYPAQR